MDSRNKTDTKGNKSLSTSRLLELDPCHTAKMHNIYGALRLTCMNNFIKLISSHHTYPHDPFTNTSATLYKIYAYRTDVSQQSYNWDYLNYRSLIRAHMVCNQYLIYI